MSKNKYPQNQENTPSVQELNPDGTNTIVLVGGITEGINALKPLALELVGQDFRVLSYDQAVGPSDVVGGGRVSRHHTEKSRQLGDIIESAQRSEDDKITLWAHSQGSVFAINAALKHPDKVERIIISNPAGLFDDAFPMLAGRFALEMTRKVTTPKLLAQRQQIEGTKRMASHPRDFMGDAIDIARSAIEDKVTELKNQDVSVDILLSNKDRVFPWRLQKDYFEVQDQDDFDFSSVSMYYNTKPSGKQHKFASKWAGHDQPIVYPKQTAKLITQIVIGK